MGRVLDCTVALALSQGCEFSTRVAASASDAASNSASSMRCRSSRSDVVGRIGGASGGVRAVESCVDDEFVVGLTLEMTDGPRWDGRIASARASFACGAITGRANAYITTPSASLQINRDTCDVFSDPVPAAAVGCPAGQVVVGIRAAVVPHRPVPTCFSNVVVICATIEDRAPSAIYQELPIPESVNADLGLSQLEVLCPAGEAVRAVRPNDGCGLDGLLVLCGPMMCDA